jgi:hypothetical protein
MKLPTLIAQLPQMSDLAFYVVIAGVLIFMIVVAAVMNSGSRKPQEKPESSETE